MKAAAAILLFLVAACAPVPPPPPQPPQPPQPVCDPGGVVPCAHR